MRGVGIPGDALVPEGGLPQFTAEWVNIIVVDSEHTHHNNIREQVGRGPQVPLARQAAIAVVTPVETSYPLKQV